MNIGFLRSSASMDELQDEMCALEKAGCERIVVDNASEPNAQAGMLGAVIARLSDGDCLIVWTLDSVANSMPELVELILRLEGKNVRFKALAESFDSHGRNRATIKTLFTQLRQFESGLALRLQTETQTRFGRRVGRPRALSSEHIQRARQLVGEGQAMDDVAREFRVSKATLYRYLSEDG